LDPLAEFSKLDFDNEQRPRVQEWIRAWVVAYLGIIPIFEFYPVVGNSTEARKSGVSFVFVERVGD
jgi:hypothetical protein